ncbi:MAG: hypothetical protein SGJ11_15120 [Phycisphaerae bacterium]|nr:hypothetical protein [Phycisphaerae bacterium]
MGLEATCIAAIDGTERSGKAQLELTELVISGRPRIRIPLDTVAHATVRGSRLRVRTHDGKELVLAFDDEEIAKRWHERLLAPPKSRLDILGIEKDTNVLLLGDFSALVRDELTLALATPPATRPIGARRYDIVIVLLREPREIARLRSAGERTAERGALWAVWPKGRPDLKLEDVVAAAHELGLVETKSMAFDATLTALRLVRAAKK